MSLRCGIVGLPNVGKSTIFNALTKSSVPSENYPFCTIEQHVGIVSLPDSRLDKLTKIFQPEKVTPATVEFIDIAGLVKGANKGEGLGNQFLGQIRQASAIVHVVRCFENDNIIHVEGSIDPIRDAELIETELLLADLQTIEKNINRLDKLAKKENNAQKELNVLLRLKDHCDKGKMARTFSSEEEEVNLIESLFLLTGKPILYVANVDEIEIANSKRNNYVSSLFDFAKNENNIAIRLCGKIEQEIAVLNKKEKSLFLDEYNLQEPGLNKLIHAGFNLLDLETYFTGGPKEVRAWTINKGSTAPQAAGEIHTDFERGFIKAEVIKYKDLIKYGSEKKVKDAGLSKLQGKEYIVEDGDCVYFHFNV
ncbi:MAG: redox-regulated ATPase YchF [Candidatus Marinimicrobia bacterium]|nr:redox-regulated ATPase YchF [Candidatus Neomarinimicrobiota bacterium]|tara:strand:+ start:141 stop:1238 length:1098 start_codon:yes stop_codon:yes gene_type:complete